MRKVLTALAAAGTMMSVTPAAHAVDGCLVLLCVAGNWKNIAMCVPPVREALRDVARGRGWPTCRDSAPSSQAVMQWTTQATCPPMYQMFGGESGGYMGCMYQGIVKATVNNAWWSDVFVDIYGGSTSTFYSPAARTQLGAAIDLKFDQDLAAWTAANPPVVYSDSP